MKKVLLGSYFRIGQLTKIINSIVEPLKNDDFIQIDSLEIKPKNPYPFPWEFIEFFDIFPESVHLNGWFYNLATVQN